MSLTASSSAGSLGLVEKISRQLLLDSEDLEQSMLEFQHSRQKALQMQYNAYALYDEEMEKIGVIHQENDYELDEDGVDHNIMRIINADHEGDEEYYEEEEMGSYSILDATQRRGKPKDYLKEDRGPAPSMQEKKNMREKLFHSLEEQRIAEMRLELAYEVAQANEEDPKTLEALQDKLFAAQKRNAVALKEFMDDYQPNPSSKLWGPDPDYTTMVKRLGTLSENVDARRERNQHKANKKYSVNYG